jgi:hypothetical protein
VDAHSRRQVALAAIQAIVGGAVAGNCETELVDFKEEEDTVDRSGNRVSIPPRH